MPQINLVVNEFCNYFSFFNHTPNPCEFAKVLKNEVNAMSAHRIQNKAGYLSSRSLLVATYVIVLFVTIWTTFCTPISTTHPTIEKTIVKFSPLERHQSTLKRSLNHLEPPSSWWACDFSHLSIHHIEYCTHCHTSFCSSNEACAFVITSSSKWMLKSFVVGSFIPLSIVMKAITIASQQELFTTLKRMLY